ncbi:MAG TPA: EAL domain-containing protein, partial [Burkholderiales bacterium]|nr:EAL domain-containing protein [Burkholderiales bacterium]
GYRAEELIGHTAAEFMPPGEAERVRAWFRENMLPDGTFKGLEHQLIAKSGQVFWLQINGTATWDADGNRTGHRGTTRDITELKVSEARISYLATRDPLTELPNRLLFNDRLEQGTINARRSGEAVGVLFIDLDRFKNINDSLGHHVGDLLLREVSQRMSACLRGGDTIARLGGDEFVIALEHLRKAEDAAQVAEKIVRSLARPVEVAGNSLSTSCSIGISIFPEDGDDASTLMKNADTAMYHAKEKGRNNFQFFSTDMNVRAVERHKLEISLRRALENGEFVLHYQPQVAFETGAVVGAEALIRWQDPERGLIAPSGFIGVAEESGLIEPIGRWVLMEACLQTRRWQDKGLLPARVAVNISARQLRDPREFLHYVNHVLDQSGLDPRYLELEMTESLLLDNIEENAAALRRLGKLGVHIAVDDFGTGYSSLAYLKQLPIDSLKVDRTFVRDIESDPDDAAIISAVIAMAHGLKLRVTAEGVETQGQLDALRALDCDEYQGYLLSKPIPADEFAQRFLAGPALKLVR